MAHKIGDEVTVNGVKYVVYGRESLDKYPLVAKQNPNRVAILGLRRPRGRAEYVTYELKSGRVESSLYQLPR